MSNYKKEFLDWASKFDAFTNSCCEITNLAEQVVDKNDESSIFALCKKLSEFQGIKNLKENNISKELYERLIKFIGHKRIVEIRDEERFISQDNRTLEELLDELNSLVGLEKVKKQVNNLIVYQQVQKLRTENNLKISKNTLHLAFTGNPGSGKTTVARIIGRLYQKIGLLSKGHFIEASRTDLIAGYQGQTALKVKSVVEKSKGGVLFIDEAYSITENENTDSYGRECLTELTKALEDYRDDLVVIVAGYTTPMENFFESNPGLKSRFNTFIEFDDYNLSELEKILENMCIQNDYKLNEYLKAKIRVYFEQQIKEKDKENNFSNGRLVRNLYDRLVMNQAQRIIKIERPTIDELKTFTQDDFI